MARSMAVRPATSSIYSGSPESTPFKKPSAVEIFKIHNTTTEISKYSEIFSEDDLFKPPIDSTTNTSSFNDEEVRKSFKNKIKFKSSSNKIRKYLGCYDF